jgi:xanthine dehydrogenase YagS FAD-binding subunit
MKRFVHINATTVEEATSILAEYDGRAKVLSGGTDLIGMMKDEATSDYPEVLVNVKTIPGLADIVEEGGMLKVGALTPLAKIVGDNTVKTKYTALAEAAEAVADPTVRNMGTLGGNLCQEVRCWYFRMPKNYFYCFRKGGTLCEAVPGDNRYNAIIGGSICFAVCPSDTAIALSALDATIVTSKRSLAIGDFYQVLGTALDDDEMVTEVQIPAPESGTKQKFLKFRIRKAIDFAIVSVATAITVEGGIVTDARIVLGAVSPVPYRATDAEDALKGTAISESSAEEAAANAVKDTIPLPNNAYKVAIAETMVKDAILS